MTTIDLDAGDVGTALLRQAIFWKARLPTGQLQLVGIDSLTPRHQRHLLEWLRANAALMQAHEARAIARQHRQGRLTDHEFTTAMRPLETIDAPVWIDDTALVRRLVQLVPREPAPARRRRLLPRRWWR